MKKFPFPPTQEIIYLQGMQNYTLVYLSNGEKLLSSSTLLRHEERFADFLRISRSHLLNPNYIDRVKINGNSQILELTTGKCVKVSRRKQTQVRERIRNMGVRRAIHNSIASLF